MIELSNDNQHGLLRLLNKEEFLYVSNNITHDEIELFIKEDKSVEELEEVLNIINKYLKDYDKTRA